jgi:hypothetical protein
VVASGAINLHEVAPAEIQEPRGIEGEHSGSLRSSWNVPHESRGQGDCQLPGSGQALSVASPLQVLWRSVLRPWSPQKPKEPRQLRCGGWAGDYRKPSRCSRPAIVRVRALNSREIDHTVSMLLAARHSTRLAFSANLEGRLSTLSGRGRRWRLGFPVYFMKRLIQFLRVECVNLFRECNQPGNVTPHAYYG